MRTKKSLHFFSAVSLVCSTILCIFCPSARAEEAIIGYDVPEGVLGNQVLEGVGVGNDFRVVVPVTIWHLGVFDSESDGIQGSATLTVQLFERNGRRGTLLGSLTFDAADPGTRYGGQLFKALPKPITLLPGRYSIAAFGFDEANPAGNAGRRPYDTEPPLWTMNGDGGVIVYEGSGRFGFGGVNVLPDRVDKGPANRYAAGSFTFTPAQLPAPPWTQDYLDLTKGVWNFPLEDERHVGSIALLDGNAFPILAEPGGNRLVVAAAGSLNGDPNGARAVAFAHVQWGRAFEDARAQLFENAILWAAKKSRPEDVVIALGPRLDTNYFAFLGFDVRPFDPWMTETSDQLPECDVVVAEWSNEYNKRALSRIERHVLDGGGIVMTMTPKLLLLPHLRSAFPRANKLLRPFGMAYRPVAEPPADTGYTNVSPVAYPELYNANKAAALLHQDRIGEIQLGAQERAIALNTITYASYGRPGLLEQLRSVYTGLAGNTGSPPEGTVGQFVDVDVLEGVQAQANRMGAWTEVDTDLVAKDRRGTVEYEFSTKIGNVYLLEIEAAERLKVPRSSTFDLVLSVDGQALGRHELTVEAGQSGLVRCLTPFLLPGPHTLRVFWDDARSYTSLEIRAVRVQMGLGPDSNRNDLQDWIEDLVDNESGLDLTNETITSYTSPVCLEGRDSYPNLIEMQVEGADEQFAQLAARPAPNRRFFVNVPLTAWTGSEVVLHAAYQNSGKTETRRLQWLPINLLNPGDMSDVLIRKGDKLLLNAVPSGGEDRPISIRVGAQVRSGNSRQPIAWQFNAAGEYTVTGTYSNAVGRAQSGSIQVRVVGYKFADEPACRVDQARDWDVPAVPPEVALEADARVFFEQSASLENQGRRMLVLTDDNRRRSIVARLGYGGPILDSTSARGFRLWSGDEAYTRLIERYEDGSQLVEMLLVLSPVLPDLAVHVECITGGITFEDGSTELLLQPSDFDEQGQTRIRFLRPATARTSVCHAIKVYQNDALVGYVH